MLEQGTKFAVDWNNGERRIGFDRRIHVQLLGDGAAAKGPKLAETVTKARTSAQSQPSEESC